MKITTVTVTPVNIPLETPIFWTGGYYPGTSKAIVEIGTDEGLTGLGEAPSAHLATVIESFAPRIIGKDPLDIAGIENVCIPPWQIVQNTDDSSCVTAFGGLEIALWDLRGKIWNQPLYQLLGGAVRKEIPFTEYFSYRVEQNGVGGEMTPQAVADYCLRMQAEHGATFFEGKLILGNPRLEIETVKVLRSDSGATAATPASAPPPLCT
jgi:glucarate dehydratase